MDLRQYMKQPHRIVFATILIIYIATIIATFGDYGITPDETGHIRYGESVVYWYTTFFAERSVFTWTNTYLYGGLYDAFSYIAARLSPLDLYNTRHLCNAFVGLLGVIAAYRIGTLLGNPWIGCLAATFLILTPRYYGHAFNNHKDLPFAVGYLWSLYGLIHGLKYFPNRSRTSISGIAIAIGCTMGIRVGGILLLLYLFAFYGLYLLIQTKTTSQKSLITQGLLQMGYIAVLAYGIMLIGWPWAQINPLTRPLQALFLFSQFPITFLNHFDSAYIKSTENPWYYAIKWLIITLPEFVFLGWVAGLSFLIRNKNKIARNTQTLQMVLLATGALFPLAYIMLSGASLYDGERHILFIVPPLVVLSALGVGALLQTTIKNLKYATLAITGGLMLWTLYHTVTLHPNQYVYFNHLFANGLSTASQKYDTDYHDNSYKQGVRWVEKNMPSSQKIRLASGTSSTFYLLDHNRFTHVQNPFEADIYLISTHQEQHRAVPGEVLHIIKAHNTPLLYIIRPDTTYAHQPLFANSNNPYFGLVLGDVYKRAGKIHQAMSAYQNVIVYDFQMAVAHINIGRLYLEQNQIDKALIAFQRAIEANTQDATLFTDVGDCYVAQKQYSKAIEAYQKALYIRPYYIRALQNLANTYMANNQPEEAIQTAQRPLDITPNNTAYLQFLARLYVETGNIQQAENIFVKLKTIDAQAPETYQNLALLYRQNTQHDKAIQAIKDGITQLPNHTPFYFTLAEISVSQNQKQEAIQYYIQGLKQEPNNAPALRDLGGLLAETGHIEESIQTLKHATTLDHDLLGAWYLLGQIYQHQNNKNNAIEAFQHVLRLRPNHAGAQQRLHHLLK